MTETTDKPEMPAWAMEEAESFLRTGSADMVYDLAKVLVRVYQAAQIETLVYASKKFGALVPEIKRKAREDA